MTHGICIEHLRKKIHPDLPCIHCVIEQRDELIAAMKEARNGIDRSETYRDAQFVIASIINPAIAKVEGK